MLPSNWLSSAISILAALVLVIYVYQVLWPRLRKLFTRADEDPSLKASRLAAAYRAENTRAETSLLPGLDLRLLRLARDGDTMTVYFVNQGETVVNLAVHSAADSQATIEPAAILEAGATGVIRLDTPARADTDVFTFDILFEDLHGNRSQERLRCTADTAKLERVGR